MKNKLAFRLLVTSALLISGASYADQDLQNNQPLTFVKDSVITAQIKAKIASDEELNTLTHIQVDTDANGMVVLSGSARSREQAERAADIAASIKGVSGIWTKVKIQPLD